MNCCQSSLCNQQGSLSHKACLQLREKTEHAGDNHPYNQNLDWILMVNAQVRRGCSHNSINSVTQCVCKKPLPGHLWMTPRSKCILCCLNYTWQKAPQLAIHSLSPQSSEQYLGQSCSLSISFPCAVHCFCCSGEQRAVQVHASVLHFLLHWHISVQGEWNNPKSLPAASCTTAQRQTHGIQARINTVGIIAKKPRLEAANLAKKEKKRFDCLFYFFFKAQRENVSVFRRALKPCFCCLPPSC